MPVDRNSAATMSPMEEPTRTGGESGMTGQAHDPSHRLDDDVVGRPRRVGSSPPETRYGGVDEL